MHITHHFPDIFTPRPVDSHKGTFGTLGIIGGASGMSGAVVLAATAAMYTGSGKTWVGFNQDSLPMPIIPNHPEIMLSTALALLKRADISTWVLGCGLGTDEKAIAVLNAFLNTSASTPILLDADALNIIAQHKSIAQAVTNMPNTIMTPHPSEAARLLGISSSEIQDARHEAAQQIASQYKTIVVLKGHQTLVAHHDKRAIYLNHSGNAGLATAGSGDVLSGVIGSLLAQGVEPWQATCGGVWLHGAAADCLAQSLGGNIGMLASELPLAIRTVRNQAISKRHDLPSS